MSDYRPGDAVAIEMYVTDIVGAPRTGLTGADFNLTLLRRTTGVFASASETPSITEVGAGYYTYDVTLASDSSSYTYRWSAVEIAGAQVTHADFFTVGTVTAYVANDAFCSVEDVEAVMQRGGRDTGSTPTASQTLDFAVWRAREIQSCLAPLYLVTPPSGSNPLTTPTSDNEYALEGMLRSANAIGAAVDGLMASDLSISAGENVGPIITEYIERYEKLMGQLKIFALNSFASNVAVNEPSTDRIDDDDRLTLETLDF